MKNVNNYNSDINYKSSEEHINTCYLAMEALEEWLHIVDKNLKIVYMNNYLKNINKTLGLPSDAIGKKVNQVYPFLTNKVMEEYRQVIKTARSYSAVEKNEINGQVFYTETKKYPVVKDGKVEYIVTWIKDVSKQMQTEEQVLKFNKDLEFLSRTAMQFVAFPFDRDIYSYIAGKLNEMVENSVVTIGSYDEQDDRIIVRAIVGLNRFESKVMQLLGGSPVGRKFVLSKDAREAMSQGKLVKVPGGLYVFSYGEVPELACSAIDKFLNIKNIYAMGIIREGVLLGNIGIVMLKGADMRNPDVVETFVNQAATALLHRKAGKQLKEVQDRLIKSEKITALGKFVSGAAHELNNPLAVIIGLLQVLQENIKKKQVNDEKLEETIGIILNNGNRCQSIINNLLNYSKGIMLKFSPEDLREIIEESISLVNYQKSLKNIDIIKEFDNGIPKVPVNKNSIEQVFINIIRNSCQAMNGRGTLKIIVKKEKKYANIIFTDSGKGIKKEDLNNIFDPFYSGWESGEGTGLGLSASAGIIEAHKGEILVDSEGENKGASFTVKLPVKI